jgi:hypothetical protein
VTPTAALMQGRHATAPSPTDAVRVVKAVPPQAPKRTPDVMPLWQALGLKGAGK